MPGEDRIRFSLALFDSIWSGAIDPTEEDWIRAVIELKGLPAEWLQLTSEAFEENTHAAFKAGAFGVPTFVLHKPSGRPEIFFGVDHITFLSRACA